MVKAQTSINLKSSNCYSFTQENLEIMRQNLDISTQCICLLVLLSIISFVLCFYLLDNFWKNNFYMYVHDEDIILKQRINQTTVDI